MPTIHIKLFAGRTDDQKRAAANAITEAVCKTLNSEASSVDIIFEDVQKQNWATGGVLWSDPR